MHMGTKKDLNKPELETVRISKNPIMVVTANGEVQTREEATVFQRIGLIRDRSRFLKKHPQFFHSGSSARIVGFQTTGPAVKNHISPTMARELIAICQTMCHS